MKWKAEEVAAIVLNEYFFSTCFVNESLFLLIGWTYLLGSARTHAHTFSTSQTKFSHLLHTCKDWTAPGTGDSVLCLMPLGQASSQLHVRTEHGVVARQSFSSVYVLCWETENSSNTHTHTHTPPEGSFLPNTSAPVTCQFKANTALPLVLPPINHMRPILRQLELRVSNWSGYKLVGTCACVYTGKQGSLCLTTCTISASERRGRARSCKGQHWEPKELKSCWWHVTSARISKLP